MSQPALKLATDYVRVALANFSLGWRPSVETELARRGMTLTDLANVLRGCEVCWTDKENAEDAIFAAVGECTEGVTIELLVRVRPDCRRIVVEEVV